MPISFDPYGIRGYGVANREASVYTRTPASYPTHTLSESCPYWQPRACARTLGIISISVFFSHITSNLSANSVGFTVKIYQDSDSCSSPFPANLVQATISVLTSSA